MPASWSNLWAARPGFGTAVVGERGGVCGHHLKPLSRRPNSVITPCCERCPSPANGPRSGLRRCSLGGGVCERREDAEAQNQR